MDDRRSSEQSHDSDPADQHGYAQHYNDGVVNPDAAVHLIPTSRGEVPVVSVDDEFRVVLRPIIERFGLHVQTQTDALAEQPWADVRTDRVQARDGRYRPALTCSVTVFLMYLATIPSSAVGEAVRPALIAYQCETRDAIAAYWTRGLAVNPRGRSPLEIALLDNVSAMSDAVEQLRNGMYWDAMTVPTATASMPRRDLPVGMSKAQARDRAVRCYRRAFWTLSGPLNMVRAELPPEHQTVQPGGSIADEIAAERQQDGPPDAS